MRNIHIFKTDKLTRLHGYAYGELGLSKKHLPWKEGRNIYITNDKEIKNGDWYLTSDHKTLKCKKVLMSIIYAEGDYGRNPNGCQKIILTTDQELDGVQVIDDIFLEWFVKNPSCEEVEVVDDTLTIREASKLPLGTRNHKYKIIIPKEEPKQETLEEYIKEVLEDEFFTNISERSKSERLIRLGAQWQAERMYSEEEVLSILYKHIEDLLAGKKLTLEEWFNDIKKL